MKATVKKGVARGKISAPSSKSIAHRLLICAALCEGVSTLYGIDDCEDVLATIDCLRTLGADIRGCGGTYAVSGFDPRRAKPKGALYCRESGSTERFIIPLAALCGEGVKIEAAPQLLGRPMTVYKEIFDSRGLEFKALSDSFLVRGPLPCGVYTVRGDVSSQFITGLIFALLKVDGDSKILITPPFESKSYVDITIDTLKKFGAVVFYESDNVIKIKGNQRLSPAEVTCEGDYSGAAFIEALNLFGGEVKTLGLVPDSKQGDRVFFECFSRLKDGYTTIDISDCPDLGPILFASAAALYGAHFVGTRRLKIKESDRGAAMAEELEKFGVKLQVSENSITVPKSTLHPPTAPLFGHGDHRIVMSLAVLCTLTGGEILGAEAISKSYPGFFRDLEALGIEVILSEEA